MVHIAPSPLPSKHGAEQVSPFAQQAQYMPVLSITEEQVRSLASGTYGRASLEHIASFGVPFFIVRRGTISTRNLDNTRNLLSIGTAFVVNLGQGPFGVTANHVVEAALAATVETVGLFSRRFETAGAPSRRDA
jgi:hypothetical protein